MLQKETEPTCVPIDGEDCEVAQNDNCVHDTFNLNYLMFLVIGIGSMLPNACIIAAMDYITDAHHKSIIYMINSTMDISNFMAILMIIILHRFIPITVRIILFGIIVGVLLAVTPLYVKQYSFIIFVSSLCGGCAGTVSCSIIAYAQIFSHKYIQAAYFGQSLSTLIVCILRWLTKLIWKSHVPETSVIIFFICSSVILLIGVLLYLLSLNTIYAKYHKKRCLMKNIQKEVHTNYETNEEESHLRFQALLPIMSIFILYFATFTIYPTILLSIRSEWKSFNDDGWMMLLLMTIFCISDSLGAQFIIFEMKSKCLLISSIIRLSLIPIAITFYKYYTNDVLLYIFTMITGVTNGQFGCQIFMKYGDLLHHYPHETGSAIMQLASTSGITLGGLFAMWLYSE